MIQFGTKTALMLVQPVVMAIIEDIIKSGTIPERLLQLKGEVIGGILALAGKSSFSWDDKLAKMIVDHMLSGGVVDELTEVFLKNAEIWVQASESKWDDKIVLPIIQQFREVISVEGK